MDKIWVPFVMSVVLFFSLTLISSGYIKKKPEGELREYIVGLMYASSVFMLVLGLMSSVYYGFVEYQKPKEVVLAWGTLAFLCSICYNFTKEAVKLYMEVMSAICLYFGTGLFAYTVVVEVIKALGG